MDSACAISRLHCNTHQQAQQQTGGDSRKTSTYKGEATERPSTRAIYCLEKAEQNPLKAAVLQPSAPSCTCGKQVLVAMAAWVDGVEDVIREAGVSLRPLD